MPRPFRAASTQIASSINPSTAGQTVIFTATVAPANGSGTPTGTVIFTIDGKARFAGCSHRDQRQRPGDLHDARLDGWKLHDFRPVQRRHRLCPASDSSTSLYAGRQPAGYGFHCETARRSPSVQRYGYHMMPTTVVSDLRPGTRRGHGRGRRRLSHHRARRAG